MPGTNTSLQRSNLLRRVDHVRALPSRRIFACGLACRRSVAGICNWPARSTSPSGAPLQVLPGDDLIGSAVPVIVLLSYAYDVPSNPSPRPSNLPDWTIREKYDIEAKAPANTTPVGLQAKEVRDRVQQMVRGLLADRFRLVMRVENKTMSVYALSVASGGPKIASTLAG